MIKKKLHENDYLYSKFDGIPLIFKEQNEKENFIKTLDKIKDDLKRVKSIDEIKSKFLKDEDLTNKEIKNINQCCITLMFYAISPILGIINLIGIFQIKWSIF